MAVTKKSVYPDTNTLTAFSSEMGASVKSVIDNFSSFTGDPKNSPITGEMQKLSSAAWLINLRVVVLLIEEITALADRIEKAGQGSESEFDALFSGLQGLQKYLAVISTGKVVSGMSSHTVFSKMVKNNPGQLALNKSEIFLPFMPFYGNNPSTYNEGKFIAEIARYQDEFHQSVLRYNKNKSFETVNAMRTTLVTMETKNPPANFRSFFSLVISFLDIALREQGQIQKENEPLLSKIDRELADIIHGDLEISDSTVSWLLQIISQAPQFSARIRSFQEQYELVRIVENDAEQDIANSLSEQTLQSARLALENAQKGWENAMVKNGDIQAAKRATFALAAVCNPIGDYALKTLSFSMGALADGVATGIVDVNSETGVFGASILIAIDDRMSTIMKDPKGGRSTADFHKERVRSVLSGKKPADLPTKPNEQDVYSREILTEIQNNVSTSEQIVDQCLRDGVKENKVEEAVKLLSMASGALMLLNLTSGSEYADKVTGHVKSTLDALVDNKPKDERADMLMAESVMLLSQYISLVGVDDHQAAATIKKGMAMFEVKDVAPAQEVKDDFTSEDVDQIEDEELGQIFFEEAKEVLQNTIFSSIKKLSSNLEDPVAFQDVRRGFHTVKGSARMVGLMKLGMLAQHVEHLLNIVRDNKALKLQPEMLPWLMDAGQDVQKAIESLEEHAKAHVRDEPYEKVYTHFADTNEFVYESAHGTVIDVSEVPLDFARSTQFPEDETAVDDTTVIDFELADAEPVRESLAIKRQEDFTLDDIPQSVAVEPPPIEQDEPIQEMPANQGIELALEPIAPSQSSDEVIVGSVNIPTMLYSAFNEDAQTYYQQLEAKLLALINGKSTSVDYETIRFAHSIAGMGKTTGLLAISNIAINLETWVNTQKNRHIAHLDQETVEVLKDALEALEAMILGVKDQIEPIDDTKLLERIKNLVEKEEHLQAYGSPDSVTPSMLKELEFADQISDSGGKSSKASTEQIEKPEAKEPELPTLTAVVKKPIEEAKEPKAKPSSSKAPTKPSSSSDSKPSKGKSKKQPEIQKKAVKEESVWERIKNWINRLFKR